MPLKRHRAAKLICSADTNAFALVMALVVFTFLTCYMTTMGYHPSGLSMDIPKALHPISVGGLTWGANRHDAMIIAIARDGRAFMNNERVNAADLAGKIQQCLSEGAESKVYIRADASARYSSVKEALDAVHCAGVKNVSFLVYQRRIAP